MLKKSILAMLVLALAAGLLAGCSPAAQPEPQTGEPVTLTVAGSWTDCRALDVVAAAFTEKYPGCTVTYEYIQDYYASLQKRMDGEEPVDLFFTTSIQSDTESTAPLLPYALDLMSREDMDLSQTFPGLIENFKFREDSGEKTKLYAVPLGAEMRGLYINTTLLESLGLAVPANQAQLLSACEVLKENGFIPFQGNPGGFGQLLVYPWICNIVANAPDAEAAYDRVNSRTPGTGEMFREPFAFVYTLVENDYYDYKRAETELGFFDDASDDAVSRCFLNIRRAEGTEDEWEKADDVGAVAFMPGAMSLKRVIDKTKEDYHSEIEYVFVPAPVGAEGGFAYLSPTHGIAANKGSANVDWSVKFLSFLFAPENNELFAEAFNVIPNTKEAFSYLNRLYDLPEDRISELGQVTFDYGFYSIIQENLTAVSKGNNPKYMQDDGNGNVTMYPLEYYMEGLEAGISAQ